MEKEFAPGDGEVVLAPVPQLAEILVVQGIEGVIPGGGGRREEEERVSPVALREKRGRG